MKRIIAFFVLIFVGIWIARTPEVFVLSDYIVPPTPLFKIPFTGADYFWWSVKFDYTTLNHFLIAFVLAIFFKWEWVAIYAFTYEALGKGIGMASCVGEGLCLQGSNILDAGWMTLGILLGHLLVSVIILWLPTKLFKRIYFLFDIER